MAAVFAGPTNAYVKDHEATGKMVIDFARNVKDFSVNKYMQVVPVKKMTGLYLNMTVEEAGRVVYTDGSDSVWGDGQPSPEGQNGLESFEYLQYLCKRYTKVVLLGDLTTDQASWNIAAQHASIKSRQMMTLRTQLAVTEMTNTSNYDSTHRLTVSSISGNSGTWAASTTARQDIKRSLVTGAELIMDDTLAAVSPNDMVLVINSSLAGQLSESQEIVDHIKGSPDALAQVRGELPNDNVIYGLPAKLYGFPVVVENTRKVTTKKGATTARSQILPTATPFLCSRPGGLVGVADSPNFSTGVIFAYEEMTVETLRDNNNRRSMIRVTENLVPMVIAKASGIIYAGAV